MCIYDGQDLRDSMAYGHVRVSEINALFSNNECFIQIYFFNRSNLLSDKADCK